MSASFYINSLSIWNEVVEKLFVTFSVFLSFCLLDLYNYTLHYLSLYSDCMHWGLPWKSAVSVSSSCLPFQRLSSSPSPGVHMMSGMAAHCICSGSSEFCSWHGLFGNSGSNQVANLDSLCCLNFNPYPTAFPYGNGMVLHFYQQQESSTSKTVHKVINKGLKTYVYSLHTGENFH
jgi:hypothetical protein